LQADTADASAKVLRHAVGTLSPKKTTKAATATQERLLRLCTEYVGGGRDLKDLGRNCMATSSVCHAILFREPFFGKRFFPSWMLFPWTFFLKSFVTVLYQVQSCMAQLYAPL